MSRFSLRIDASNHSFGANTLRTFRHRISFPILKSKPIEKNIEI
jgi:hypothetical protein